MTQDKPSKTAIKPPEKKRPTPAKKLPKKITADYLHNSGLYYLQRFASSSTNFRAVMMRKVKRSCHVHKDQDFESCRTMVDALILKFEDCGLLNDDAYLRGTVASLRRRGLSRQAIHFKLKTKGFTDSAVHAALTVFDTENNDEPSDAEMIAALRHAKKKKLGPFAIQKAENSDKALANLARKGFSYDTARFVLEIEKDEAEEKLAQSRL